MYLNFIYFSRDMDDELDYGSDHSIHGDVREDLSDSELQLPKVSSFQDKSV